MREAFTMGMIRNPFPSPKKRIHPRRPGGGKRILILSASAGSGHVRAAEALEKAFRELPDVEEVRSLDALKYTNRLFRDFYSKLYTQLVEKAPAFLGWWYKTSDEPWKTDKMRHMLDRLNTAPLVRQITEFDPDITVCTHFLPATLISYLIAEKKLQARLSIVVTDLDFHAMWLSRIFHRYFVALEETRIHLRKLGLPAERITISGIPIDPCFRFHTPEEQRQIRSDLGLDPELPVILVSAGALGLSPAEIILESLFELKKPAQIVLIAGRNEELKKDLEDLAATAPSSVTRVKIIGYTTAMNHWMAAATLLIGKPGGLTISEAMATGLPMVIVSPIPGQEERNSDHLLEKGIAIKCNEFTTLSYKVEQLLNDPDRLERMRHQALFWAKPDAAMTIARTLLDETKLPQDPVELDITPKAGVGTAAV
jgi:processive 1,2-diacylglycerol beta-glucosyltransferase